MITREIESKIKALAKKYPVLWLTGPRQSGKTTLLKKIYSKFPYVTLEDADNLDQAINDPRGFLNNYPKGAVIDEVQNAPQLFSYIQGIVDSKKVHFALSGSQNFLLSQHISQSLAGRAAILNLLPLSIQEIKESKQRFTRWEDLAVKGGYPRLYNNKITPEDFYPFYINTYLERDVRQVLNVGNLKAFSVFLRLLAGRNGQLVNLNTLATDAGISPNTAKSWLSVLEASYIIYFLQPHYKNFNKRLTKTPKLFFYDTGVACSLLGIHSANDLQLHFAKGAIFENFIINEFIKRQLNQGKLSSLYFWQSKEKKEIDLLVEKANDLIPFEIKSSSTRQNHLLDNLTYWQKLSGASANQLSVIYAGNQTVQTKEGNFVSWEDLDSVFKKNKI